MTACLVTRSLIGAEKEDVSSGNIAISPQT
jgi:hypothetical protein